MSIKEFVMDAVDHITHPLETLETVKTDVVQDIQPTLDDAKAEMARQIAKWGVQDHPSYTPATVFEIGTAIAEDAKRFCDRKATSGIVSWTDIFAEEVLEAIEEAIKGDWEKLDTELVQCIAVAQSWRESLNRNKH